MISSDTFRGYNDLIILFILLEEPSYGYEISKSIREITEDQYIIKETTLYSAMNRLEKNEYVTSFSGELTFGKKRTYYQITPKGLAYYQEKLDEWELTKKVVDQFIK